VGRLVGSLVAIALAAFAAPACARAAPTTATFRITGAVTLSWHSQAGACEAVDLCGIAGSVRYAPGETEVDFEHAGSNWEQAGSSGAGSGALVIRETRRQSDGTQATCIDAPGIDFLDESFSLTAKHNGVQRLTIGGFYPGGGPLSAGRCAGPLPQDIAAALPSAPFRPGHTLDLGGTRPFAVGPFAGEVTSTLVAKPLRHSNSSHHSFGGSSGPGGPGADETAYALVGVPYRIDAADGGFEAAIAGADQSDCQLLDACQASGRLTMGLDGLVGSRFTVTGLRLLKRGQRYTRAQATADLHSGKLIEFSGFDAARTLLRTTTESLSRLGEPTACSDQSTGPAPQVSAQAAGTKLVFRVDARFIGGIGDVLRTRCAGPGVADVVGKRAILAGSVPLAQLGDDTLSPALTATGKFTTRSWTGTRSGTLSLSLTRTGPIQINRLSSKEYNG